MAHGNIGDVPAATFAEYVNDPSVSPNLPIADACDAPSGHEAASDAELDALVESIPELTADCELGKHGSRPSLAHRLYSERLHVRAKAKLQRNRLLSGPLVDIYVGKSKRHWVLHRNLLCHHSEQLETELEQPSEGRKKSSEKSRLDLMDQDPAGFELLVKWMYQGRLDDVGDIADPAAKYEYAVSCHKLYLLCDRFDMPLLRNVAMDQYRKGLHQAQLVPDAEEINEIYRQSPQGSPFRRLMTKIAARQIMDPDNDRNVETYRDCFTDNPEFAIDLVNSIKQGTGGMLFDDPTEDNGCEYHDHEAGPNCHLRGKGKFKQALKGPALPLLRVPRSASSGPFESFAPQALPHPPPQTIPTNPANPPRQARRHGDSVGPLRRRLTSPASSTVEMSIETASRTPPSPNEQKDKFRKPMASERRPQSPLQEGKEELHQTAPEDNHLNSENDHHLPQDKIHVDHIDPKDMSPDQKSKSISGDSPPRRGLWEWARTGTGRLSIINRIPHPEWKGPSITSSKAANSAINGSLENGRGLHESQDDFSIPSAVATDPENPEVLENSIAATTEGLGISNSSVGSSTVDSSTAVDTPFAETKTSSDELLDGDTPSPQSTRDSLGSPEAGRETPSRSPVPKYKIVLASNMLNRVSRTSPTPS